MALNNFTKRKIHSMFVEASIQQKLDSGKQLVIKSGIDPTSEVVHLGHIVGFLLLKDFIKLGHKVVFIVGDFTAQLGDDKGRPKLTLLDTKKNSEKVIPFIERFLGKEHVEIRRQSEWFGRMPLDKFLSQMSLFTVKDLLSHGTYKDKFDSSDKPLQAHEFVYPLLMAFDSVVTKTDIEIGSVEQKFNLQFARKIMQKNNLPPEDFILNKRLPGLDGAEKMSKSLSNYVSVLEDPSQQICDLMKISLDVLKIYFELLTSLPDAEIEDLLREASASPAGFNSARERLVDEVLSMYIAPSMVSEAIDGYRTTGGRKVIEVSVGKSAKGLLDLLIDSSVIKSKREGRRLLEQQGVRLYNVPLNVADSAKVLDAGSVLEVGKTHLIKLVL
jgi:tyrosyl-tRNA synthetase